MKSSKAHYSPVCSFSLPLSLDAYTFHSAGVHVQCVASSYTHASKSLSTLSHASCHRSLCVYLCLIFYRLRAYGNNFGRLPISPSIWSKLVAVHLKSQQRNWYVHDLHATSIWRELVLLLLLLMVLLVLLLFTTVAEGARVCVCVSNDNKCIGLYSSLSPCYPIVQFDSNIDSQSICISTTYSASKNRTRTRPHTITRNPHCQNSSTQYRTQQ